LLLIIPQLIAELVQCNEF